MLESITLSPQNTIIPNNAFKDCSSLTSITNLNNTTTIGESAFYCSSLTGGITLPNVSSIGDYAFCGCSNITKLDFTGSTFTQLPISATEYASRLEKIILPSTLTYINRGNLWGTPNLVYVKCLATTPPSV